MKSTACKLDLDFNLKNILQVEILEVLSNVDFIFFRLLSHAEVSKMGHITLKSIFKNQYSGCNKIKSAKMGQ